MTDAEINQTIAECCGWQACESGEAGLTPWDGQWDTLPDYCNDLNAMHAAEQTLRNGEYEVFRAALGAAVRAAHSSEILRVRSTLSATARQRAEAFISAIRPSARRE